ncbi:MAG TPA: tellurite resistance TerB family protein [Rhodothermales bacterium]|nr:tellurite resistance TerB family protein [Rhodothermales bacterium]
MNPFDNLSDILDKEDVSQTQSEAFVDLVVWTMYVDGTIKYQENAQVDEVIKRLNAVADMSLTPYLNKSIATFRDVWHDETQAERALTDIAARLGNDTLRQAAYDLSAVMARADDDLAEEEQAFLDQVKRYFGL